MFFSGGTPNKGKEEYWRGNIPWFSPKDIKNFNLTISQDCISEAAIQDSATRLIETGTILVVGRSGVLAHTLPVGIVRQPSTFNQDIKAIVPDASYDSEFVALYLKAKQEYVLKDGVKRGPTVHSLIADFIENIEIPKIAIAKQRQIAARLKAQLAEVDKARQAAEAQLRDAAALKTKVLNTAFLNNNCIPIGSVSKVQSGYAFKSETFQPSGTRLLRNANILPGTVYWDETVCLYEDEAKNYPAYKLNDGDVLISLDRPLISSGIKVARVGINDLPALLVQRVGRFLLDEKKIDARYLYAFLQTDMFISAISGHDQSLGVPHISPAQIESILLPLPSIAEQRRLCSKIDEITFLARTAHTAIQSQLQNLFILPQKILSQTFGDACP